MKITIPFKMILERLVYGSDSDTKEVVSELLSKNEISESKLGVYELSKCIMGLYNGRDKQNVLLNYSGVILNSSARLLTNPLLSDKDHKNDIVKTIVEETVLNTCGYTATLFGGKILKLISERNNVLKSIIYNVDGSTNKIFNTIIHERGLVVGSKLVEFRRKQNLKKQPSVNGVYNEYCVLEKHTDVRPQTFQMLSVSSSLVKSIKDMSDLKANYIVDREIKPKIVNVVDVTPAVTISAIKK